MIDTQQKKNKKSIYLIGKTYSGYFFFCLLHNNRPDCKQANLKLDFLIPIYLVIYLVSSRNR